MSEQIKENLTLTPRLQAIADRVPQGAKLADIGTDHGHLPLWLLTQGRLAHAIASDIRPGPLHHAKENARFHGLTEQVSFRLAAGLDGVRPDECDTISIAGMGGETIAAILEAAPWTADGNYTLLLQPMTMLAPLRQWLWAQGYEIQQEAVCCEGQRYYLIWQVCGGAASRQEPIEACYVSPALLRAPGAAEYLHRLCQKECHALAGMERGQNVADALIETQRRVVRRIEAAMEELKNAPGK